MEEHTELWVCMVRYRAYPNPGDLREYICFSLTPGRELRMKHQHKEAGCGRFTRVGDR